MRPRPLDALTTVEAPWAGLQPIKLEALLHWTYAEQRADVVIGRGAGLFGAEATLDRGVVSASSACGCAAVERIQRLGVRISGSGGSGALAEDAELVHGAVERLYPPIRLLVIGHARQRTRPDPMVGVVPRARPVTGRRHEVAVRHETWDKRRNYGTCPVDWQPSMACIDAARLEFHVWDSALDRIGATLRIECRMARFWPLPRK